MRFKLPKNYADARVVQRAILEEAERLNYAPDAVFAVRLALEEGLIDVIKDAREYKTSKSVFVEAAVEAAVSGECCEITIVTQDGARTVRISADGREA